MDLLRAVPIVTVSDLRAAVAAYQKLLGVDVLMDHCWIVTLGSGREAQFSLMTVDQTAPCTPCMSLDVDDAYRNAVARGLEIVHPLSDEEWGARRFFFRDADGSVVNVLSHREPSA